MKWMREYGSSILRVWVVFLILAGIYVLAIWLVSMIGSGVWQWFVILLALATSVGILLEFLRRRGI